MKSRHKKKMTEYMLCAWALHYAQLLATPETVDCQTSLSKGLSRQEYWSGLPFPSPGDLPDPRIEPVSPVSPALAGRWLNGIRYFQCPNPRRNIWGNQKEKYRNTDRKIDNRKSNQQQEKESKTKHNLQRDWVKKIERTWGLNPISSMFTLKILSNKSFKCLACVGPLFFNFILFLNFT